MLHRHDPKPKLIIWSEKESPTLIGLEVEATSWSEDAREKPSLPAGDIGATSSLFMLAAGAVCMDSSANIGTENWLSLYSRACGSVYLPPNVSLPWMLGGWLGGISLRGETTLCTSAKADRFDMPAWAGVPYDV
jgi:hypothetical protein